MDMKQLRTFYYASTLLSFSKTAEQLNFTQPAVSKQMKALEEDIGSPLFTRMGNKLYLTDMGKILRKYAIKFDALMDEMETAIRTLPISNNKLNIGADISFITNNLQAVFSEFYRTNPKIQVKISVVDSVSVFSQIYSNEIDVGFVSGDYDNPNIESTLISDDPMVLVVSSKIMNRYQSSYIRRKYPLIVYHTSSAYSEKVRKFITTNRLNWPRRIEFSNLEAVKSAAISGVGAAVVTKDTVQNELTSGVLSILNENLTPVTISTYIINHTTKKDWELIQTFREVVLGFWIC